MSRQQQPAEVDIVRLMELQAEKAKLFDRLQEIEAEEEKFLAGQTNYDRLFEKLEQQNKNDLAALTFKVRARRAQLQQIEGKCKRLEQTILGGYMEMNARANETIKQLKERRGFYDLLNNPPTNESHLLN